MGCYGRRTKASMLTTLLLLMLVPSVLGQAEEPLTLDEGLNTLQLTPDQPTSLNIPMEAGDTAMLLWSCASCDLTVNDDAEGVTAESQSPRMLTVEAEQSTLVEATLSSTSSETITLMLYLNDEEHHHQVRPSPETTASVAHLGLCATPIDCIDTSTGMLASHIDVGDDDAFLHVGDVHASSDEYIVFNTSAGDTLEWQWLATTEATTVEMYHQTSTEESLLDGASTSTPAYAQLAGDAPLSQYWTAPEDGRFVARLSTQDAKAVWAAHVMNHPNRAVESLVGIDLASGTELVGHGATTSPFDWTEVHALHLHANLAPVKVRVDQLLNGAWVQGTATQLAQGEAMVVYPYPDVSGGRLVLSNASVFSLEVSTASFADHNGLEAPSYVPPSLDVDNASWPVINLTETTTGEFTLAVHDTSDTYRLVVDGWEDSIHFVQFTIVGDVEGLEWQLWDIDQSSSETIATDITQPVSDQLKIGLQVGRGTHFLQLRFQNASEATPHLWGEDVGSKPYVIQPAYSLIDEGEEPWFPPSEDAVYWGNIARWFMGILFLLPVLYLAVHVRRSQRYAASVAEKKQRLEWYTSRLDSGESSARQARTDMAKALHAVAQLEWQEGLETWGPHRIEHRTEDIALAVWNVDQRLASKEGAWPLVVGVHVMNGTWDLAALRFDAPEGAAYSVVHVEPRFLFQGEEVFLDTMGPGHQTYLIVELDGEAAHIDVELNGRMDGEPFAARIPQTLHRNENAS